MEEKILFGLMREMPATLAVVLLFAIWTHIRNTNRRLDGIENKMISRVEFDNIREDVEDMKKNQVWCDVLEEIKEAFERRISRIEAALNGMLRGH